MVKYDYSLPRILRLVKKDLFGRRFKYAFVGLTVVERSSDSTSRDDNVLDLCLICLDAAFAKCGHMCCCLTCSLHVKTCPLCRRPIEQVLKIYSL
ncbi:hypothetical protein CARUB_v10018836mg [Capsella rubella]|uniref:RING-type domain-containing protein n=1 Tax=Capsella rubella TaxID=81985 RepID=R0HE36_9BRAS|nr:hypothetical protein CARUB_v10018836mg [Capsella rubella]